MDPFYDENYFYNNYMPYDNYGNGFTNMYNPYSAAPKRLSPIKRLTGNMDLKRTLNTASKTIYTVNQIIPLVYQVGPIISNARNAFRVIKAVNTMNSVDLDEIDREVSVENKEANTEETFENMV